MMLEQRLKSLLGTNKRGPNCWNATIMYFDPTEPIVYVTDFIMDQWLKLNTWRVPEDEIQDGDIIVFRSTSPTLERHQLIHTAVLIDKSNMQFFHKGGIHEGWEIVTMAQLSKIYNKDSAYYWHRAGSVISKV